MAPETYKLSRTPTSTEVTKLHTCVKANLKAITCLLPNTNDIEWAWIKTPLAPAGGKVIVHNRRMERASWADRGTNGFFIDQAPQHYRNYKCYIPATKGIQISNTVEFFPEHFDLPHASPQDKLSMILQDLMGVLTDPIPNSIFHPEATEIRHVVNTLQDIIEILKTPPACPARAQDMIASHSNLSVVTSPTSVTPSHPLSLSALSAALAHTTRRISGITSLLARITHTHNY
jgi:hypothetical protein